MGKADRQSINLDDGERNRLHANWSRSGKNLILTIMDSHPYPSKEPMMRQVELRPQQVAELITFLSETLADSPTDR
jgi:hypothetical protein